MNAPATIAQLALAREQSQRCEYKTALRNFEGVLAQLDECAPTSARGQPPIALNHSDVLPAYNDGLRILDLH